MPGTFTDATASRMPVDNDITYSVALGDVDVDGDLAVPNQRSLAGVALYTQAVLDQRPVQMRLTNVVGDITLR